MQFDTVIRGGTIVDGSGADPMVGSVAICAGRIAAVGTIDGNGREEIDATGCVVTPGFIDIHTHYDGQALWSGTMAPSSYHGVTTAIMGNCGVGFAPCRPSDRELMLNTMEGVEDIPGAVMAAGLDWNWETFPEFMDALDAKARDINVAMLLPHSPLRIYAMGARGADRTPATAKDIVRMQELVKEAMDTGAVGLGTSRIHLNRRKDGEPVASYGASEEELIALTRAMGAGSGRVFQVVPEPYNQDDASMSEQIRMLGRVAAASKNPVTVAVSQINSKPNQWRVILDVAAELNRHPNVDIRPQVFPRPHGIIIGYNLSANPFSLCPSYQAITDLSLAQRVAELRKPETRRRILNEKPDMTNPLVGLARDFDYTYVLESPVNYAPDPSSSVSARARSLGISAEELVYDLLLEENGNAMLIVTTANYARGSLDYFFEMMNFPGSVLGLGDGGAHCSMICDATFPTFMLTYWVRDRPNARMTLQRVVQSLSADPADLMGLNDRGRLAVGYKADLNVIDLNSLRLDRPVVCFDLPAGGRRLDQHAHGYRRTFVAGQPIIVEDRHTGNLPGRLLRRGRIAA